MAVERDALQVCQQIRLRGRIWTLNTNKAFIETTFRPKKGGGGGLLPTCKKNIPIRPHTLLLPHKIWAHIIFTSDGNRFQFPKSIIGNKSNSILELESVSWCADCGI